MSTHTPAELLTGILVNLHALSASRAQEAQNSSTELPGAVRPYLLTLHVLYPHLLLDALDLLDRGLVTRLCAFAQDAQSSGNEPRASSAGVTDIEQNATTGQRDIDVEASQTHERGHDPQASQRRAIVREMEEDDRRARTRATSASDLSHRASSSEEYAQLHQSTEPAPDAVQVESVDGAPAQEPRSLPPRKPSLDHAELHSVTYHVRSAQAPYHHHPRRSTTAASTNSSTAAPLAPPAPPPPQTNTKTYHVLLTAWHCSCPAFAHAAFSPSTATSPPPSMPHLPLMEIESASGETSRLPELLRFGWGGVPAARLQQRSVGQRGGGETMGKATAQLPPCCKHLMASVLAEAASALFGRASGDSEIAVSAGTAEHVGKKGVVEKWVGVVEAAGWAVGGP